MNEPLAPSRRSGPRSWLRWGSAAGWALVAAALLWSSGPDEPPPWEWLATFERGGGDKLVHAGLFGVQAWLLCRCRPGLRTGGWLAACFGVAVAYGVATEAGQLAAPERDASLGDAVADAAGAAAGVAWFAWRARRG